jgi:BCCT family betaine/carnitine transporter
MRKSKNSNTIIIKTDKVIFLSSLIFLLVFTFPLLIWPEESQSVLNTLKILIENNVGGIYQLLAIVVLVFVIWLAISRFGNIVLGNNDYNFSTFSWASMLFCAGVATGILYWGTIEWAYYMDKPPLNAIAGSNNAIELAATYGMFHWGVIGWAFYSLPAVAVGYMYYVKKVSVLRISKACSKVLGKHTDGIIGKSLDILFMIGLLGSTGTSMGLGTPMISAGVSKILDIEDNMQLKLIVIFFCAIIFSISVYLGLSKGIKKLSRFNTITAFIFLVLVFVIGPTTFIFKMSMNSIGILLQDFVRMVTWTDPLTNSRFVEDWTIFYWAWWIAVGPFMGIFIAKISGGRSIRQIILGTVGFGSLGCILFYGILGNYALHLEITNQLPLVEMVNNGNPAEAIVMIISSILPETNILLIIFCLMSAVFMATSFDSTSYTLASCATEELPAKQDPSRWQRLFWAFTLIILPIALMYVGGLESLKIAVLISAFPLIFVYIILMISLYKNLKEHK